MYHLEGILTCSWHQNTFSENRKHCCFEIGHNAFLKIGNMCFGNFRDMIGIIDEESCNSLIRRNHGGDMLCVGCAVI